MKKMLVGFLIGVATVTIVMFGIPFFQPSRVSAQEKPAEGLSSLLPDLAKINREALITPLREAQKAIWDKDILSYYRTLLARTDFLDEVDQIPAP